MVNTNNNFNILPWYTDLAQQNHNKWYAFGEKWPLIMLNTKFIPFQFVLNTLDPGDFGTIKLVSLSGNEIDTGLTPTYKANTEKEYCVIMLPPRLCDISVSVPVGQYYAKVSIDGVTYYSDVISVVDDVSDCLKITYWNTDNLYYNGGEINYSNDFRYEVYLQASIGKPAYEFEEELTSRLGYKFLESQISNKLYKFNFLAPEYICDAIRLIRLSDYIQIQSGHNSYNALTFSYEPTWEEQGNLASVAVEFTTDTIIQKLPSFNRNQRENFYNALLSTTGEPVLFDEEVVAQYYSSYEDAIKGKLVRDLSEADVSEIDESSTTVVDLGSGAAMRINILALFKKFGGSGGTVLNDWFYFDESIGAVRTKYNLVVDKSLSFGGVGESGGSTGVTKLIALDDVNIVEPVNGQSLVYENGLWINKLVEALDTDKLNEYLTTNKYATQSWVSEQQYATTESITAIEKNIQSHADRLTALENLWFFDEENNAVRTIYDVIIEKSLSFGGVGESGGSTGVTALSALTDVELTELATGQVLSWNGTYWTNTTVNTGLDENALADWLISHGYLTASSADTQYASLNAFNSLNNRVTDFLDGTDTDDVINKWKELEAFLAGQTESSTLAELLSVKADKTTVETLQGYFTNGSANNALKLGNQLPAYYATAANLTAVSNRVKTLEDVIGIDANGDVYIKKNGETARNFYTYGAISFGGVGESGGGTGVTHLYALSDVSLGVLSDGDVLTWNGSVWVNKSNEDFGLNSMWNSLTSADSSKKIDISHIPNLSWNKITSDKPVTLSGYGITDALSTSGGTITGSLIIKASGYPLIEFKAGNTTRGYYGFSGTGVAAIWDTVDWQTLIHSGNIDSYAVKYAGAVGVDTARHSIGYDNSSQGSLNLPHAGGFISADQGAYGFQLIGSPQGTSLSFRGIYNNSFSDWKTIAFVDSNVASATKLQTARSIWGQSFDGTRDVNGNMLFANNSRIRANDTDGTARDILRLTSSNSLMLGLGTSSAGYHTYINGNNVYLRYGTSQTNGLILNSSGNVLIGTTDDNGGKLQISNTPTTTNYDVDMISLRYNASWSDNQDSLASITTIDSSGGVVGRFGVTYASAVGKFLVKGLYRNRYDGSGVVFSVDGNGNTRIYRVSDASTYLNISVGDVTVYYDGVDSGDGFCNHNFLSNGTSVFTINGREKKVHVKGDLDVTSGASFGNNLSASGANFKGTVEIEGDLVVKGAISFGGVGESGGGEGVTSLSALTDVTLTTLAAGQSLVWNGSAWTNQEAGLNATALWDLLIANTTEKINISHIPYTGSVAQGNTNLVTSHAVWSELTWYMYYKSESSGYLTLTMIENQGNSYKLLTDGHPAALWELNNSGSGLFLDDNIVLNHDVTIGGQLNVTSVNGYMPITLGNTEELGLGSLAYKSSLVASDIPSLDWSKITSGKPTTLSEYGITDGIRFEGYPTYVAARFLTQELATKANSTYIEWWQSGAGWFNHQAGKFIVAGATSSHFLKGDGSLDSTAYLPLSGGTINGELTIKAAGYPNIAFRTTSTIYGYLGFSTVGIAAVWDTTDWHTLIHSGNYSDYALPKSGGTVTGLVTFANNEISLNGMYLAYTDGALRVRTQSGYSWFGMMNDSNCHIYTDAPQFYMNKPLKVDNGYDVIHSGNIKDYNAGSATKLQTARSIWGQSFDGTGNVGGGIGNANRLEFTGVSSNEGHGGFIDFHFNGSSADFTSRIIESSNGRLTINDVLHINRGGNVGIGTSNPSVKLDVVGGQFRCMAADAGTTYGMHHGFITGYHSIDVMQFYEREYRFYANGGETGCIVNVYGDIIITGALTFGSDERYKTKISDAFISIEDIANAPLFNFKWNDRDDNRVHLGTTAQYWNQTAFKNAVIPTTDDKLWTMSYSEIAMGNAIILARELLPIKRKISEIDEIKQELREAKCKIQQLETELNNYRRA